MRKGFTVTLLAVAIAMLGSYAMAEAPVIGNIPDVVVGDAEGGTESNVFVYSTDIDLTAVVTDDVTSAAAITWSYIVAGDKIRINNADTIATPDEAVAPASAKVIYGPGSTNNDPADEDATISTITFRNNDLSPVGGPNVDPVTVGIVESETAMVVLYASDGDKASSAVITVYTNNDGADALSNQGEVVYTENFVTGGDSEWVFKDVANTTDNLNDGICIVTPEGGQNFGSWYSPDNSNVADLVDNAVYRIRFTMSSNQTTVKQTPLWGMLVDNRGAGGDGNMFGGDYAFLDNQGGANGIATAAGHTDFTVYYTPLRVNVAAWKSDSIGAFRTFNDEFNDLSLRFRVLDSDDNIQAWEDSGQICLKDLEITRFDQSTFVEGATLFSSTMTEGDFTVQHTNTSTSTNVTTWDAANETVTVGNTTGISGSGDIIMIYPGTGTTLPQGTAYLESWPIEWVSNDLLKIEYVVSAGAEASEDVQPAILRILVDSPSNEVFFGSYAVANEWGGSSYWQTPKFGEPETMVSYVQTAQASAFVQTDSAYEELTYLRPRLDVMTNTGVWMNPQTGTTKVHSVSVKRVAQP